MIDSVELSEKKNVLGRTGARSVGWREKREEREKKERERKWAIRGFLILVRIANE